MGKKFEYFNLCVLQRYLTCITTNGMINDYQNDENEIKLHVDALSDMTVLNADDATYGYAIYCGEVAGGVFEKNFLSKAEMNRFLAHAHPCIKPKMY